MHVIYIDVRQQAFQSEFLVLYHDLYIVPKILEHDEQSEKF